MTLMEYQQEVDLWIKKHGVRYFDVKTNMLLLMEEVGETSRLIARRYGEQSFKEQLSTEEQQSRLEDELADILFVLTCIANQTNVDLESAITRNFSKKSRRDSQRHKQNDKLLD